MENASKALLIGAGTLIAILILAIATGLFRAASGVAKTYDQTMQSTEITKFNTNFTNLFVIWRYPGRKVFSS